MACRMNVQVSSAVHCSMTTESPKESLSSVGVGATSWRMTEHGVCSQLLLADEADAC